MEQRKHKHSDIQGLIRQMLHSQHKSSTDQSDGDTVDEWLEELNLRILNLLAIAETAREIAINDPEHENELCDKIWHGFEEIHSNDIRWLEAEQNKMINNKPIK